MFEVNERNRTRWLWVLLAVTALYGLASVIGYYTTASFGPVWFAASLLVYGVLFASAVYLAIVDTGETEPDATPEPRPATTEPEETTQARTGVELVDHETIYTTRTGRLLRTRFRIDGTERSLLFALVEDGVLPITAIEDRLDEIEFTPPEIEHLSAVERCLEERSDLGEPARLDPEQVPVRILAEETLYRARTGRVLRVTYVGGDGEERRGLYVQTDDGVEPIGHIEARLDAVQLDELPVESEGVFEEALAARSQDAPEDPSPSPGQVIRS